MSTIEQCEACMTRGAGLSSSQLRRLDEIVDDWARWFCVRVNPAAHYAAPAIHGRAVDSSRQWESTELILEGILRGVNEVVDVAVDELDEGPRRVLQAWAWQEHYNRQIVARVRAREAIERERQAAVFQSRRRGIEGPLVTEESVEAAKLSLLPKLRAHGVEV